VLGRHRHHLNRAHPHLVAGAHLVHVALAMAFQPPGRARRRHQRSKALDPAQRWQMHVVSVQVRDHDSVDPAGVGRVHRRRDPHERSGAPSHERIGEQARAVQLDQHAGVAQPRDLEPHGARLLRGPGWRKGGGTTSPKLWCGHHCHSRRGIRSSAA